MPLAVRISLLPLYNAGSSRCIGRFQSIENRNAITLLDWMYLHLNFSLQIVQVVKINVIQGLPLANDCHYHYKEKRKRPHFLFCFQIGLLIKRTSLIEI